MELVKNVWCIFEGLVHGNSKVEQEDPMAVDSHPQAEVDQQPTVNGVISLSIVCS